MGWRLAGGFVILFGSIALGYFLYILGWLTEPRARRIVRFVVKVTSPVVLCLCFWGLNFRDASIWLLPVLGVVISVATIPPAYAYCRAARLHDPQTGSFLASAVFSNVGYFGGLTAFALFGEPGYALAQLYLTFFSATFYTLGFGIAAHYGAANAAAVADRAGGDRVPRRGGDAAAPGDRAGGADGELRFFPFIGMAAGLALNLAGVPRPEALVWVSRVLIPLDTGLYLMALGSQLHLVSPRPYWRPTLAMAGIKFLYTPFVAWLLATGLGLSGLPRQILLLQAATPVAVSPLMLPLLFRLDRRLMNAVWLVNTLAALPWFLIWVFLLQRL